MLGSPARCRAVTVLWPSLCLLMLIGDPPTMAGEPTRLPWDDPALQPPPVHIPPSPAYGADTRIFQGIPGIERAPGGRLWATWYGGGPGEGPWNYVMLVTSGDDGRTWSDLKLVIDPPGSVRAFDPCLWLDPTGRLWLFWAQGHSHWDGRAGVWAVVAGNPDDDTPTWSPPRRLCNGIMMNKPVALSTGEWLLPAAIWSHKPSAKPSFGLPHESGANAVCSTDEGATWTYLGGANVAGRACDEHHIVERKDGSLWMLVRTRQGISESVSTDRGKTWSVGKVSRIGHIPAARFFVRRLASGNLLLVKHNPPDGKTRSHLAAYVSADDGVTWTGGLMLDERRGVSYPDGFQAPDGTIYIVYDYSRTGAKQILMTTFSEEDVAAGEAVSGRVRSRVVVNQATGVISEKTVPMAAHADGDPLLAGPGAVVEPTEGELDALDVGAMLFTNRKYVVANLPEPLRGKTFLRSSIDWIRVVCKQAGVAYVVTPLRSRNRDTLAEALLAKGFRKARLGEFLLFGNLAGNICTTFQKRVDAGEELELGKWGVLILPAEK